MLCFNATPPFVSETFPGFGPVGRLLDLGLKLWVGVELVINILKDSGEEIDFSDDILNFVTFRPRGRPRGRKCVHYGIFQRYIPMLSGDELAGWRLVPAFGTLRGKL